MKNKIKEIKGKMEIRLATIEELENWWNDAISNHPNDNAYLVWKECFLQENLIGKRKTFYAFEGNKIVGQCTLLLDSQDKIMTGSGRAELIKLEIILEFRGTGLATKIYNAVREYAKSIGINELTIGVEPCEVRNIQIYFHWGFTNYLQTITETYPPKDKFSEGETIIVLCYSQKI